MIAESHNDVTPCTTSMLRHVMTRRREGGERGRFTHLNVPFNLHKKTSLPKTLPALAFLRRPGRAYNIGMLICNTLRNNTSSIRARHARPSCDN
jgi:hypothetical protein